LIVMVTSQRVASGSSLDDIAGYISYLNREKDVRSFSYPLFENVHVPMSDYGFEEKIQQLHTAEYDMKRFDTSISLMRSQNADRLRDGRLLRIRRLEEDFERREKAVAGVL